MNNRALRRAQERMYANLVTQVIKALIPFYGAQLTTTAVSAMVKATYPMVTGARTLAQNNAYRDYVQMIGSDPVPKMELGRFTDKAWAGTINRLAEGEEVMNEELATDIGTSSDQWARDAEWGQRYDVAKKDPRITRVARVDFEPPTCPFCTLLNSRGAVYLSGDTAAQTLHVGDTCELIWVVAGSTDYPGIEHTREAEARYKDAVKAAPNSGTSAILKALNEQHPDRPTGRVKANAEKAAQTGTPNAIKDAQARVATLEKMNPSSASAKTYRDAQLTRNRDILKALETESP